MSSDLSVDPSRLRAALSQWFIDDSRQGLLATDTDFRVLVWNRWMELRTGRAAADVCGRSLFDLFPEASSRGIADYFEGALAGRVTVMSQGLHRFLFAMPSTNPDLAFREMPQSGYIGPLLEQGVIVGVLGIIEDASDQLATEAVLRRQIEAQKRARATAEKALRAKDDFLSTLSHEIRTPLNAVLGWARILLSHKDVDRELLDRALRVIERNATAQAKMIDDMLDMARVVAGKLRLESQPVDLLSVTLAALDVVTPSATAKRIAVERTLDPKTPRVFGDPDRLQQMIWNLLSNALKFTEPGGTIEVRLETVQETARIVVRDTGQGISPEFLPHVFERFRQNDASSARRYGGLGLGLALVRELAELHGGSVGAASDGLGKGSTFTITLPTAGFHEANPSLAHTVWRDDVTSESLAGIRVLLVEDEPDARELAVTTLEEFGAQVVAATSTADALALILSSPPAQLPDVLVSDIGMSQHDGYELIRRVRALPPEQGGRIPAVTLTGYASPEDVDRAMVAGFQLHMAKPMDPSELAKAVATLAKSSR